MSKANDEVIQKNKWIATKIKDFLAMTKTNKMELSKTKYKGEEL